MRYRADKSLGELIDTLTKVRLSGNRARVIRERDLG